MNNSTRQQPEEQEFKLCYVCRYIYMCVYEKYTCIHKYSYLCIRSCIFICIYTSVLQWHTAADGTSCKLESNYILHFQVFQLLPQIERAKGSFIGLRDLLSELLVLAYLRNSKYVCINIYIYINICVRIYVYERINSCM